MPDLGFLCALNGCGLLAERPWLNFGDNLPLSIWAMCLLVSVCTSHTGKSIVEKATVVFNFDWTVCFIFIPLSKAGVNRVVLITGWGGSSRGQGWCPTSVMDLTRRQSTCCATDSSSSLSTMQRYNFLAATVAMVSFHMWTFPSFMFIFSLP